MQHVNGQAETNCIDGAIRVSVVVFHYLEYTRPRSFPGFGSGVFPSKLGDAKRSTNTVFNRFRKRQ